MKKSISKVFALVFAIAFCLCALCACSQSQPSTTAATEAAAEVVTEAVAEAATEAATEATTEAITEAATEAAAEDFLSGELTIYAAASMTESLGEAIGIFKEQHPNVEVTANYGSSGDLVKQIIEGGTCDVFISAANKQMNQIDATSDAEVNPDRNDYVVQGTRIALLENKCVLAIPDDNPAGLTSFEDLKTAFEKPDFIFAMGGESVPVGAYTQKILAFLGIDEASFAGQITYGEDVKGVTSVVKEGSAQAGVIYATDAYSAGLTTVGEATEEMTGGRVVYPAAQISTGTNPDAAAAFLAFIQTPEASKCFEAVGFTTLATAASDETASAEKQSWTFTDQADNEVTVEYPVDKMVVLQHHSLDILCQLGATDKIVGVEADWERDLGTYIADIFPEIRSLPTPGTLKEANVEEVAALEPDVVIAASQADEDICNQLRDMGIPVVVVSLRGEGKQAEAQNPRLADADAAYTEGCQWAVETLGKLTGHEQEAADLWNFCEESRALVEDAVGEIDDASRVKVFIANEGNQTYGNDKYVGCMLLRAGGINVAAADIQGYKEYTLEQLANWDPDVIIVQDRYPEVYEAVTTQPEYQELKAVKNGKVILAPYWTKPWGNPDADSIALGELWLAHQFYPDQVSADLVKERAEKFYDTFYGVAFTGTVE